MKKNILIMLVILFVTACSQTASTPVKTAVNSVEPDTVKEPSTTIPADFVPEHIKRSHIEVVPHY